MKPEELDAELECSICGGSGEITVVTDYGRENRKATCERCLGEGWINRFGPNDPTEKWGTDNTTGDQIILREWQHPADRQSAVYVEQVPQKAEHFGFEAYYGDGVPDDMERVSAISNELLDRFENQLGSKRINENGEYEPPEESSRQSPLPKSDLPSGAPGVPGECDGCSDRDDLCPHCIVSLLKARGDDHTAGVIEQVARDVDLL